MCHPRSTQGATQEPDPLQRARVLREPRIPLQAPLHWARRVAGNFLPFQRVLSHTNEWFPRGSFPVDQIPRVCLSSTGPLKMNASSALQSPFPERE